jgi:hypothetical protein
MSWNWTAAVCAFMKSAHLVQDLAPILEVEIVLEAVLDLAETNLDLGRKNAVQDLAQIHVQSLDLNLDLEASLARETRTNERKHPYMRTVSFKYIFLAT